MPPCPFCEIAAGRAPATYIDQWEDAIAIRPRGGVHPGHVLVIPRQHVANAVEDPAVTAATMQRAAELGRDLDADLNLITSVGPAATQTVTHLHIHVIPRWEGDGDGGRAKLPVGGRFGSPLADTIPPR